MYFFFFFQAEDGIRDIGVTGVQTCALPIALRSARDLELRGAEHVFTPSAFLRELAIAWGVRPERVSVLPNPAPAMPELAPRDELRARLGVDGPILAFAGR